MTNRCKALMRQIICFSSQKGNLSELLGAWVRIMKPCRADWLSVLKELKTMDHPLYLEVAKLALLEESFETNIRDYTKIIHSYGKQNRLKDAENTLSDMKRSGFICDQVTLTAMVDMYSKAGHLEQAKEYFDEIKLLGQPFAAISPDDKICGLLINAYGKAGQSQKARVAFENMRRAGIEPSDKCIALTLAAYEKESKLNKALKFLIDLEKDGIMVGKEASEILSKWFRRLGVVEEVELVLREYTAAKPV
ncbi:Pentatricopeptide repeat-containing protein [Quillaja saponaria]|uniref:Pentatricopeptide repeat-containing protein n=1 Tax=Quillaja saponaria TaxID=32244 RepID=A0AAD7LPY6_QUISA|nr:Pentatricopeptide repeat-containing protein [Quillaja saponaria]